MAIAPDTIKVGVEYVFTDSATLEEAVYLALGAASSCWDNLEGAGTFESERAGAVGRGLLKAIEHFRPAPGEGEPAPVEIGEDGNTGYRPAPDQCIVQPDAEGFFSAELAADPNLTEGNEHEFTGSDDPHAAVEHGVNALVQLAGRNSEDHGFHEDLAKIIGATKFIGDSELKEELHRLWLISKLDLTHEEISEALGELRSGHASTKVYFLDKATGEHYDVQQYDAAQSPLFKPEGFGVELADAVIRIADMCFVEGIDLGALILLKHEYNATRPYKHGRKL